MTSAPSLLACPFCGSVDVLVERESGYDTWVVACCNKDSEVTPLHCGAQGGSHELTREGAIAVWNKRTPPVLCYDNLPPVKIPGWRDWIIDETGTWTGI